MLKKIFFMSPFLLLAIFAVAFASDEGNQTKCPIMGNDVNKQVYYDYKDVRVFFCCPPCIEEFKKDPEAHLAAMKEQGVTPMKLMAQSVCPVSGEELQNRDVYVDVKGKRVFVCCASCKAKVEADPDTYFKVIADRGEYLESVEK